MKKYVLVLMVLILTGCSNSLSYEDIKKINIGDDENVLTQTLGKPKKIETDLSDLESDIEVALKVLEDTYFLYTDDDSSLTEYDEQKTGLAYALTLIDEGKNIQTYKYIYKDEDSNNTNRFYIINLSDNKSEVITYFDE